MSVYKKQHFVPQFYMKNFSENKKSFSLYRINEGKIIKSASFSNQCCQDYYYGENLEWEIRLSHMECNWAETIRKIKKETKLTGEDIASLKSFLVYQMFRTKGQVEHIKKEGVLEILHDIFTRSGYPQYKKHSYAIEQAESMADKQLMPSVWLNEVRDNMDLVSDLSLVVVNYQTHNLLISSDTPVIAFNPYFEDALFLPAMGLILICPISPKQLLVIYDAKLYPFYSDKLYVKSTNEEEVNKLNNLQLQNAHEILFGWRDEEFGCLSEDDYKYSKNRKYNRMQLVSSGSKLASIVKGNILSYSFSFSRLCDKFSKIPKVCRMELMRANVPCCIDVINKKKKYLKSEEGKKTLLYAGVSRRQATRGIIKMIDGAKWYWRTSDPAWRAKFLKEGYSIVAY